MGIFEFLDRADGEEATMKERKGRVVGSGLDGSRTTGLRRREGGVRKCNEME